jgi:ribosomal protein S18 acetylase RimI-like enzyme
MEIRQLAIADADQLAQLSRQVFVATYGAAIPADILHRYLDKAFNPQTLATDLSDSTSTCLGAWQSGQLIGFSRLSTTQPPDCLTSAASLELAKLYVAREYHGRGVAAELLSNTLSEAVQRGHSTLWLYVWDQNQRAIAFYKKWNFTVVGSADLYFDDILFHDLVMECNLDR